MAASPELNKTSTVIKQFVVDYTTATFEPLTEHEVGGLDYRYVYGNDRLSVNITGVETSSGNLIENGNQIRLYYHMDYLGTTDYLTSPVSQKVTSWTHYNEWGEITHNAVLKTGQRELDLVKRYATHDYDAVLGMYYAKARMYDAENRRFASVDPVKGVITEPMSMMQYLYVVDNPLRWVDPLGLDYRDGKLAHLGIQAYLRAKYPRIQTEVTVYGVRETESGRGFVDAILPQNGFSEVYEIKPIYYINSNTDEMYDVLGEMQLHDYITAINYYRGQESNNKNASYRVAEAGTSILSKINKKKIPFPLDESRYIEITTSRWNHPGMIYYTIKDKKKNEKIEYAYKYTCEDEKTWEAYKKETTITPSASYSYALTYGDTEYDVEFFDGLYSWVSQAKVKSYRSSEGDVYTQIVFSDGTTRYRYDGFERWGTITPRTVTINDALQIYERNSVIWNDGEGLWSMHTEMWADTLNGAYSRSPEGATHALSLILGAEKAIISSAISEVITIFVGGKEITIKLIQEYSPL